MSSLAGTVEQSILRHRLLRRGARALVAVSGGLDSMALLHLLHQLAPAQGWRLTVAHFNHRLRGAASDADEALVQRQARHLGLPCVVGGGDVKRLANLEGISTEMAARRLRHQFLARSARRLGLRTLVTAHHADDRIELFWLRLLRGAAPEGLAGMKRASPHPLDARLSVVRPLFDVDKEALRAWARAGRIRFREDASNQSARIPRNKVRLRLLPLLRRHYQPAVDRVILRTLNHLADAAQVVEIQAAQWLATPRPAPFDRLAPAIQRAVLNAQLQRLGAEVDYDLVETLRAHPHRAITVGPNRRVQRDTRGRVTLEQGLPARFSSKQVQVELTGSRGTVGFGGTTVKWQVLSGRKLPARRQGREFFDADKVGGQIVLRHWQAGDRYQPIGLARPVKLQDWFTNRKVPRQERHARLVAATADGAIFWVEDERIAEGCKVTAHTRHRLRWNWERR